MSFGKMNTFIDIIDRVSEKDSEGFTNETDKVVASTRAYKEERHGSKNGPTWQPLLQPMPYLHLEKYRELKLHREWRLFDTGRYEIISVEHVRGMYIEVAAEKMEASKA